MRTATLDRVQVVVLLPLQGLLLALSLSMDGITWGTITLIVCLSFTLGSTLRGWLSTLPEVDY